jgi:signal transduction histidine kinase
MTIARILPALAALAAGAGVVALVPPRAGVTPFEIAAALAVGWSFVASGLIASHRRPENRIGQVMVFTGFAWFAGHLAWSSVPALFTAGTLVEALHLLGVGYLLLTFPSGRLDSSVARATLLAGAVILGPLQVAWMLAGMGDDAGCGCPENLLQVVEAPEWSRVIVRVQQIGGAVLATVTITLLVGRWRAASPALRRAVAPVVWTGACAFGLLLVRVTNDALDEPVGHWPDGLADLFLAAIPIAFMAGLLRARLARTAVSDLLLELQGGDPAPSGLRDALARALGDPSVSIAYWLPDGGRYVDLEGRPVDLPEDHGRAVTLVERDGRRIGAIVHDRALRDEPELVHSVSAAAALALDNGRLQAELRARLEDLRRSRQRIVESAEAERRRIERNLHDGTQQRLVSVAMALGLADARLETDPKAARPILHEARRAVTDALTELRELSQGIHPGILTERGLAAALDELAYRSSVPLDLDVALEERLRQPVEAAVYFLVSESLTNIAKHANATVATVTVARHEDTVVVEVADDGAGGADASGGSGLRGLADRVQALGGRLLVGSPAGGGTVVRAEIPCGS